MIGPCRDCPFCSLDTKTTGLDRLVKSNSCCAVTGDEDVAHLSTPPPTCPLRRIPEEDASDIWAGLEHLAEKISDLEYDIEDARRTHDFTLKHAEAQRDRALSEINEARLLKEREAMSEKHARTVGMLHDADFDLEISRLWAGWWKKAAKAYRIELCVVGKMAAQERAEVARLTARHRMDADIIGRHDQEKYDRAEQEKLLRMQVTELRHMLYELADHSDLCDIGRGVGKNCTCEYAKVQEMLKKGMP